MLAACPGHRPATYRVASKRNTTMAATLIEASQNSNSPKSFTEIRFVAVSVSSRHRLMAHAG